jgi:hypothetical protein
MPADGRLETLRPAQRQLPRDRAPIGAP